MLKARIQALGLSASVRFNRNLAQRSQTGEFRGTEEANE
jgi:hypothetical protein